MRTSGKFPHTEHNLKVSFTATFLVLGLKLASPSSRGLQYGPGRGGGGGGGRGRRGGGAAVPSSKVTEMFEIFPAKR